MPKDAARARMLALTNQHFSLRIQLELALETSHRDSRYSENLADLMKREEQACQENFNSQLCKDLISKVDDALRQETQRFFSKNSQHNIKRWASLIQRVEREKEQARNEIALNSNNQNPTRSGPVHAPTLSELDVEAKRLEEDYNRNWFQYEGFHLNEAFKSQAARVDTEWAAHEQSIKMDYDDKRSQLLGTDQSSSLRDSMNRDQEQNIRWQHPEKQKTLIHTAPVLSPSASTGTSRKEKDQAPNLNLNQNSGFVNKIFRRKDSGSKEQPSHITAELTRLERKYEAAAGSLHNQKAAAKRWMSRQQIRLLAQAKEVHEERQVIASLISLERCEYEKLLL